MINKSHSIIFGISGFSLTANEIDFFKKFRPWGIILFARNINSLFQLKNLTESIKLLFNDNRFPILIDQEGGRVNRFKKIINLDIYTAKYFGNLYETKKNYKKKFLNFLTLNSKILNYTGININTTPLLDLFYNNNKSIIGDRAFSKNINTVITLSKFLINFYKKKNIVTVVKHIPGHGSTNIDSHLSLPNVKLDINYLKKNDFLTFKKVHSDLAMTAHILYSKIDKNFCATQSKYVIDEIIRKYINFKGILISDDISMKALKGSIEYRAKSILNAGCNLLLHCNGIIKEMRKLSKITPVIDSFTERLTIKIKNKFNTGIC